MNTRSIRFRLTVWYAGLVTGLLVLFGAAVYIGLGEYLRSTLTESLKKEAQQIGETLLVNVELSGETYVTDEIEEHFAPEINGLFIRVTRTDGSILYESGPSRDGSFDPRNISHQAEKTGTSRIERLPNGTNLMISAIPFTSRTGESFVIEAGASLKQSESVLHGLLLTFAVGLPLVVAVAIGGGYFLMSRALTPVGALTRTAEQITSRNLSERLPEAATG